MKRVNKGRGGKILSQIGFGAAQLDAVWKFVGFQ